jgi:hypothetical protein
VSRRDGFADVNGVRLHRVSEGEAPPDHRAIVIHEQPAAVNRLIREFLAPRWRPYVRCTYNVIIAQEDDDDHGPSDGTA